MMKLSGEAVVQEPPRALSEAENWAFDTQGWVLLRGVASPTQLRYPERLTNHPTLQTYAHDLCGVGYRLDLPLRPVAELAGPRRRPMVGGDSRTRDPAREYFHVAQGYFPPDHREDNNPATLPARVRQCQGLLAVWALDDVPEGQGFALVPCSHLSDVEPPRCLSEGEELPGGHVVRAQPRMERGDLLLCAEVPWATLALLVSRSVCSGRTRCAPRKFPRTFAQATMHGLPRGVTPSPLHRQIACGYISRTAPPAVGGLAQAEARSPASFTPTPAWHAQVANSALHRCTPAGVALRSVGLSK
jgi:hypothetical protein